jgi:excisionase family DNA binding protein
MQNQNSCPDAATTLLVEMLKPVIQEAVHAAVIELSENVKPRPPRPLTVQEAADYLSIPKSSLYQLTSKKQVPFFKQGKKLFFYQDELDKWIREGR